MKNWNRSLIAGVTLALALARGSWRRRRISWITTKVKMTLLTTDGVHANAINVDTIDGRVTLQGTVGSQDEKAKAELAAKKVEGVREMRNLLAVVAPERQDAVAEKDDQIKTNVRTALKKDASLDDSSIDVASVNAGTVVLSGTAKTMTDHLRALEVASAVPGVRAVASEITSPDTLSDAEIWHDTKSAAKQTGNTVADAARGTADTVADASKQTAHGVADASKSAAGTVTDAWITSDTKVRLMANTSTPAFDINVDTTDGKVTLFGTVPTAEARAPRKLRRVPSRA
jgi:osmotically-inducible protein OsmY